MKRSAKLTAFEQRLGHTFAEPELLINALTHASFSSHTRPDNERLEFLGDRVLGLIIAQALLEKDHRASEGLLAPRFNALVRKETCADIARKIDLGEVLKMGRSEILSGGRSKAALLGDAMEALIAAIYLDKGLCAAQKVVLTHWQAHIDSVDMDSRDAKTILQEYEQARKHTPPEYIEVERSGPAHAPCFTIEVRLQSGENATAQAGNKRQAEQAAAKIMLERLDK